MTTDLLGRKRVGSVGRSRRRRPWWLWGAAALAALAVLFLVLPRVVAEPLRRRLESDVNRALTGYRVRIGELALNPLGLSVTLRDFVVFQEAYPEPAVAVFPTFEASVQWRALFSGGIVGDLVLDRPRLNLNLPQLRSEARDDVDVQDRGWQDALREIYPLEINEFVVHEGALTYVDAPDAPPLEITDLELTASNVRNVWSPEKTYPSELRLRGTVFGKGSLSLRGRADFLAEPHPGVKVELALEEVPLAVIEPATRHWNAAVRGGVLTARGRLEYAPTIREAHLESAEITGLEADLLMSERRTGDAEEVARKVGKTIDESTRTPETIVTVDRLEVTNGELGVQNLDADPEYRVFVDVDRLAVSDFTNRPGGEPARLALDGRFMGDGETRLRARFVPMAETPDLQLGLAIRKTELKKLNPVWKAHGGFDVAQGSFSFFSELAVRDGRVDGYVKPIFAQVDVYDREQDAEENPFQQLWEGLVGGVTELFQNQPRDTVAARTDVSGSLSNPETSTLQILFSVLRNAFIDAILPGLERGAGRTDS